MSQVQVPLVRMQEYVNKREYLKALKEAQSALSLIKVEETPYLAAVILLHILFCQVQLNRIPQASNTYFKLKRFLNAHPSIVTEKLLLSMHGIALRLHERHPSLSYRIWDLAWMLADLKKLERVKKILTKDTLPLLMNEVYQDQNIPSIHQWIKRALKHVANKREAFNLHMKNVIHALETKNLEEAQQSLEAAENLATAMVNTELLSMVKKLEIAVLLKDAEWQLFSYGDSNKKEVTVDENVIIAKIDKAETLAREFNDVLSIFQAKLLKGLLFKYLKEYTRALEEWKEAMELKNAGVPIEVIYQLTIQIALTLAKQQLYQQALDLVSLIESKIKSNDDNQGLQSQVRELKNSLEQILREKERKESQEGTNTEDELEFPFFVVGPGTISFLRKEALMIEQKLTRQAHENDESSSETSTNRRIAKTPAIRDSHEETSDVMARDNVTDERPQPIREDHKEPINEEEIELHGQLNDLLELEIKDNEIDSDSVENSSPERNHAAVSRVTTDVSQPTTESGIGNNNIIMETEEAEVGTLEEQLQPNNEGLNQIEEPLEMNLEVMLGDESMNEAIQGPSRELTLNVLVNLLQSRGYSVEADLEAVSEPNIIATKGKLKKHRLLISICEDPIDAGFASTLLAGHLLQGTKVVYLLNGTPNQVVGSKDVVIIQTPEELESLLK